MGQATNAYMLVLFSLSLRQFQPTTKEAITMKDGSGKRLSLDNKND